MTLLITVAMLQAGGHQILLDFLQTLQSGCCSGATIRVGKLAELLPTAALAPMDCLNDSRFQEPAFPNRRVEAIDLDWQPAVIQPVSAAEAAAWRQQSDNHRLLQALAENRNPYEQIELLGLLWERLGPEFTDTAFSASLRQLTEAVYIRAGEARLWGVVRRAAGLLEKVDDALEDAVAAVVVRQHQLSVGRAYSGEAVIVRPLSTAEISERLRAYGGDDPRARILLQEIVLFLGMLIKAEPGRFKGVLTLRPWHLLLLITGALAREQGITQGEAFEILLDLSPYALLGRLHQVIAVEEDISHSLMRLESLHYEGGSHGLKPLRFSAANDPTLPVGSDWNAWREANGILTRLPEDFYSRVWEVLRHCRGLIIGDQLDVRNRLDSEIILADMTATEKAFALQVEHLLNTVQAPEYRQLSIETLLALAEICRANPRLQVDDDLVLDVLIGNAVYLTWRETHPESAEGDYNERSAEAWSAFYVKSPHLVANALILSLSFLLGADERGVLTAA